MNDAMTPGADPDPASMLAFPDRQFDFSTPQAKLTVVKSGAEGVRVLHFVLATTSTAECEKRRFRGKGPEQERSPLGTGDKGTGQVMEE